MKKPVISTEAKEGQRAERSGETSNFSSPGEGGAEHEYNQLPTASARRKLEVSPLRSARWPTFASVGMTAFDCGCAAARAARIASATL